MACSIQGYTTAQCIQEGFPIYDQYADIFLQPNLRKDIIKRANLPNFMLYLYDWKRDLFGNAGVSGERVVTTRTYMWEEINYHTNSFQFTIEATDTAGAAGAPVTATIIRSISPDGNVAPYAGFTAFTNVGGQIVQVRIKDVTADEVTLAPINGQALDFTGFNYTFTFDPNFVYNGSCSEPIPTTGWTQNQPQVVTGVIQKYENGICICDNALTHYGYDYIPAKMQLQDPLTGNLVDTWCLPGYTQDLILEKMFYGQFIQMMFGQFDYTQNVGTRGLIPSILNQGGYNMPINTNDPHSAIATLKIIAQEYYRLGIDKAVLWCDIIMYQNLNQMLAQMVGSNNFSLPIWNGEATGNGHIEWYGFKSIGNFLGVEIDIKINVLKGWEAMGLNQTMQDFAMLIPDTPYITTQGQKVPMVEVTRLQGCEAWQVAPRNRDGSRMWYYDFRQQGLRTLNIYAQNEFGMDIHGLPFMGIITGNQCNANNAVLA